MRLTALAFACALAACGAPASGPAKDDAAQSAAAAPVFPSLTAASYRVDSIIKRENGETMNLVQYRSGARVRMEFSTAQGRMATILDPGAGAAYTIMPAQRMAIRVPLSEAQTSVDAWASLTADGVQPTPTGACSVAGETGTGWTLPATGDKPERTSCVTADGILLKATEAGETTWEVTSIARGPQDAGLFVVPAGYRLQDFSAMMKR